MLKEIPIFHIASMARSGETLLLHLLNQHSDTIISHNLNEKDSVVEKKLFNFLMSYEKTNININHKLIQPYCPKTNSVLIVKQGVWEHKYKFKGAILVRNPLDIYTSLRKFDDNKDTTNRDRNWFNYRVPRFVEWLKNIEPSLIPEFLTLSPIEQFCFFYNRRMGGLLDNTTNLFINYETLVEYPSITLSKICNLAGLRGSGHELLNLYYNTNQNKRKGHGHFNPNSLITTSSIENYKDFLSNNEIFYIIDKTKNVAERYGYCYNNNNINVKKTARTL